MEAIILDFMEKTIKVKNIDTKKVSYLKTIKKNLKEGDVLTIKINNSYFSRGNLFTSGEVKKLNNNEYFFDECILCRDTHNDSSKPLCKKCWKELQLDMKMKAKEQEEKRKFKRDPTMKKEDEIYIDYRKKFKTPYRARDGHWVRSKGEKMIDDCLFRNKVFHIYEKKLPGEQAIADFYIPEHKIWIEYWGRTDEKYNKRRERKVELYRKRGYFYKLVQITKDELSSIDDVIEDKLLQLGVKIELE